MSDPSERPDPLLGRAIGGKFVIEAKIAEGAMGAVYRARQTALDRPVALKVLHAALTNDATFAARFQREAKAASRLDHPGTIRVIDYGQEADGLPYIAMELLDGRDLLRVIDEDWPMSHDRIVDLLSQTLAALGHAHDAGILHRDLKPENIMVLQRTADDGTPIEVVKVCDFGIAKMLEPAPRSRKLSTEGLVVGTPEYMSPEQARGEPIDARSDVYAVGVILYQLLTRRLPFEGNTPLSVVIKALQEEPRPIAELGPTHAPALEPICMKAMSKRSEDRYASAREMRAALRATKSFPPSVSIAVASGRASQLGHAPTLAELSISTPLPPRHVATPTKPVPTAPPKRSTRAWLALPAIALAGAAAFALRPSAPAPVSVSVSVPESASVPVSVSAPASVSASASVPVSVSVSVPASASASASASVPVRVPVPVSAPASPRPRPRIAEAPDAAIAEPTPTSTPTSTPTPPPPAPILAIPAPAPTPPPPPPLDPARARVEVGQPRSNNAAATSLAIARGLGAVGGKLTACLRASVAQRDEVADGAAGSVHLETDDQGYVVAANVAGPVPPSAARCIEQAITRDVRIDVDTGTASADVPLTLRVR